MATSLFGEEMWDTLKANPETAALLADPEFKAILEEIRTNPSSLGQHIADPRVAKILQP